MPGLGRRISLIGLLAVLYVIAGSSRSEAKGVVVTMTTVTPTPDPLSTLDFQLALEPGTALLQGDYLSFTNIPNFNDTPPSGLVSLSANIVVNGVNDTALFSLSETPVGGGLTDVKLTLEASNTIFYNVPAATSDLIIGNLFVLTDVNYPPPADSPILSPINYVTQFHDYPSLMIDSGSGTTQAIVVPEPASMTLVGVGLCSFWLMCRSRRRFKLPA